MKNFFPASDPKKTQSESEKEMLKFWEKNKVFQQSIDQRSAENEFRFFDGPPFATGAPHYGHILAGTIKDAIPRYQAMLGKRVNRKWGWDCHGVPVEFQVEKENQIGGKPGIEKMGVGKFNELCRSIVMRCADEWRETVSRMGRAVDFENDYKTMDIDFMEGVWSVFKALWNKGLIYEGEKVVPYSPKLGSALSNFEANLNYQDIDDPAITVQFKINDPKLCAKAPTYFLAWTTTPWTLPSNLALCVNPKFTYAVVEKDGENFIMAKNLVEKIFGEEADITLEFLGKDLVGTTYEPLFPFFKDQKNAFQVLGDNFVGEFDGTGVVHMAPNFGEDDARVCKEHKILYLDPNPIDENGYFSAEISELNGKYFREDAEIAGSKENNANVWVLENLKTQNKIFKREQIRHQYPFCWRTDAALQYRGVKNFFVAVTKIKEKMIKENQNINWIPGHLKDGRFGKILEGAPDWSISRDRFWGCPIPIWRGEKSEKMVVIGTREELAEKLGISAEKITDLHKHFIDDMTWEENGEKFVRVPEVLDCWFESGSMPYASNWKEIKADFSENVSAEKSLKNTYFLARHAESQNNVLKIYNSKLAEKDKYGLSEKGKKQAESSAKNCEENFDIIITSPFKRTKETAAIFAKEFNCEGEEMVDFREVDLGNWDGKSEFDFRKEGYTFTSKLGETGESFSESLDRAKKGIEKLEMKFSGKKILIVSHGGIVGGLGRFFSKKPLEWDSKDTIPKNAVITPLGLKNVPKKPFVFSPANFIAEGIDQTRGWFYTLHVLGCGLFGKNVFENVITNGIVLAEDGSKMSKSKKNYPDPNLVFEKYGADAVRFYLLSSPVVRGENFRFTEKGVQEVLKSVILPIKSAYNFFSTYANIDSWTPENTDENFSNELDLWIFSELQVLVQNFREKMDTFQLDKACELIPVFIDALNNWYLRRNRRRFWANGLGADKCQAYTVLFSVLKTLSQLLAPITPFFADKLWQDLGETSSVHLSDFPKSFSEKIELSLNKKMELMQEICSLSAVIRARSKIKLRQPLSKLQVVCGHSEALSSEDLQTIAKESNVKKVEVLSEESAKKVAEKIVKVNAKLVGKKFGSKVQVLIKAGKNGEFEELSDGKIKIADEILSSGEFEVSWQCQEGMAAESGKYSVVILETEISENLRIEGLARDFIRGIQDLRKTKGFEVSDRININYTTDSEDMKKMFENFREKISQECLIKNWEEILKEKEMSEIEIEEEVVSVFLFL